jgi:hypothetical protein
MMSSLDRKFSMTFFPNIYGKSKTSETLSLNELADKIESTVAPSKKKLPWVKCATFGDVKSDKGALRNNENLKHFDGIEIDYDGGEISPLTARSRLAEAGVAAIIYTSASHTAQDPRFRVLLPCSKTLRPDARANLVMRVNGLLDGDIDGTSFTLSQAYYFGKIEGQEKDFKLFRVEGDFIDNAAHLEAGKRGKRQRENAEGDVVDELDDSGSGAAWRMAKDLVRNGGTIEEFEEWAAENPWKDYEAGQSSEKSGKSNPAIDRTWGRAVVAVARSGGSAQVVEFKDEGDEDPAVPAQPTKKTRTPLFLLPMPDETLDNIPPLKLLYQNHLARGWLSALVSPGGIGKSALSVNEAISMACGIDFLSARNEAVFTDADDEEDEGSAFKLFDPLRVGVFNFEDDNDTMRRRIAAARQYHNISFSQIGGRLFFSGAEQQAKFSRAESGKVLFDKKTWTEVRNIIESLQLDVLSFDPFVSTHVGDENSNGEMAEVWGKFRELSNEYNIAIQLTHHTRKGSAGTDLTSDDARGGSAIKGVVRFMRVVNRMQDDYAKRIGIETPWSYIRVDDGKANHAPPSANANWRKLVSIENEYHEISTVAVERWEPPQIEAEAQEAAPAKVVVERDLESKPTIDQTLKALYAYGRATGKSRFGLTDFRNATENVLGMTDRFRRDYIKKLLVKYDCIDFIMPKIFVLVEPEPREPIEL